MDQTFKPRLLRGDRLIGSVVTLPSPSVVEMLADVGFDWVFIDMEHGPLDLLVTQGILQATGTSCAGVVRVPGNDVVWIKRVLDLGCDGIIVPQVNTAAEAEYAVAAARYPPAGVRGVGAGRAQRYGRGIAEYVETATERIAVIVQVETVTAVKNVRDITAVPGLDGILIGPSDLSASMGLIGQVTHPSVVESIATVKSVCKERGTSLGIFAATAERAQDYLDQGFTLVAVGVDTLLLLGAAQQTLERLR